MPFLVVTIDLFSVFVQPSMWEIGTCPARGSLAPVGWTVFPGELQGSCKSIAGSHSKGADLEYILQGSGSKTQSPKGLKQAGHQNGTKVDSLRKWLPVGLVCPRFPFIKRLPLIDVR